MMSGLFVVVRVGVHQLSVSPNTSHPMLQIRSKLLHVNSTPVWTACTYDSHPGSPWKVLSNWALLRQACRHLNEAVKWDQPGPPYTKWHYWYYAYY
jgi:hypothetical protein